MPRRRRRALRLVLLLVALVALSGCNADTWKRGGWPDPVTREGKAALHLWQGFLICAIAVGLLVIGMIVGACVLFRKRSEALPRQVKYNLPVEAVYTIAPLIIVFYLFYFTVNTLNHEDTLSKHPDLVVGVVGFQWSWQFNYPEQGLQVTGRPGVIPELVLPTNRKIRFVESSPDVVHSFWVIPFVFKRDVVPGRENQFEVTITKAGQFDGKCTEYCGLDHDRMLFTVRAVSPAEFDRFVTRAKAAAASGAQSPYTVVPATAGSGSNA